VALKSFGRRGRSDRAGRQQALSGPEALEGRDLLSYTPLGFSLPDLTVTGQAAPVAAWGGQMAVTVTVRNIGASSMIEPLALQYGAVSSADAGPSTVAVYISRRPRFGPGAIKVGEISFPGIRQNSLAIETESITLPQQPPGFAGNGGKFYVEFQVDPTHAIQDFNRANNITRIGVPVEIAANLPDLFAIALDTPPVMQPGDTIQPNIKVANFGTANPSAQGSFEVDLVASTDTTFGPGDTVLSRFIVTSLPPLSLVPSTNTVLGDVNITNPLNVVTLEGQPVTLPVSSTGYFLGVIVDPQNNIREIHEIGQGPSSALSPIVKVGNPIPGLPPAGVNSPPAPITNEFPVPAFGPVQSLLNPTTMIAGITNEFVTTRALGSNSTTKSGQSTKRGYNPGNFGR
jgi:hypothetical protein